MWEYRSTYRDRNMDKIETNHKKLKHISYKYGTQFGENNFKTL